MSWPVRRAQCSSGSAVAQRPITCVPCLHGAEGPVRGLLWDGGVSSPFHGMSKPQQASGGSKSRRMECPESSVSLATFWPALISVISILNNAVCFVGVHTGNYSKNYRTNWYRCFIFIFYFSPLAGFSNSLLYAWERLMPRTGHAVLLEGTGQAG